MNSRQYGLSLSIALLTWNSSLSSSEMLKHHWHLNQIAVTLQNPAKGQHFKSREVVWVSFLQARSQQGLVFDQADRPVVRVPTHVRSPYDNDVSYEVRSFYKKSRPRVAMIVNIKTDLPGQSIASLGIDTGHRSDKLIINPSIYFGWASTLKNWGNSSLSLSIGAWVGGKTTERPCLDDYSRAFQCHTLLSWADREDLGEGNNADFSGAIRFQKSF